MLTVSFLIRNETEFSLILNQKEKLSVRAYSIQLEFKLETISLRVSVFGARRARILGDWRRKILEKYLKLMGF